MVGANMIGLATVKGRRWDAAESCGLVKDDGANSVKATLESGLNKGISEPLASLDSDYSDAPFHDPQLTVESPSIAPESVDSTAWPQMDRNVAYIGIVGKIVETIEPHTESDPNAVLIQLLGACGNSLGRTAFYKVDGARHYANIYSVLVGKSSKGRKGTSWQRVREFADWADEEWNKKCVKSGLVSGEGLKWEVRDAVFKNENGESKCVDSDVKDKRRLILEPEFARVLDVMKREGNTLSSVIREAWDNGNLASMARSALAVATNAHISLIGHITSSELKAKLDSVSAVNGFANRILFPLVKRSKLLPRGGNLKDDAIRLIGSDLGYKLSDAKTRGGLQDSYQVTMTPNAARFWESIYEDLSAEQDGIASTVVGMPAQVIFAGFSCGMPLTYRVMAQYGLVQTLTPPLTVSST